MITIRNGAGSSRLCTSFAIEPLENMRCMPAMPTGLAKHDCIINTIWNISSNKMRCGNELAYAEVLPRMGALWCANCPFRAESGMIPNVIRHTEQRGKGRLHDGQAVAFILRCSVSEADDQLYSKNEKKSLYSLRWPC